MAYEYNETEIAPGIYMSHPIRPVRAAPPINQEIELAPGIFLTKRQAPTNSIVAEQHIADPERLFLDQASPADQLEYLVQKRLELIHSNNMLDQSNKELQLYAAEDVDCQLALEENILVLQRQREKIINYQIQISNVESLVGRCTSQFITTQVLQETATLVQPGNVSTQEENADGGVYL